ncbi:MAG: alpha-ketoacid dehydrogenase subunit beta [Planctomycetes bacterium]|jgi:pyruvate dehydrogenase E1 component beta subunit|nr:alpha-ketoacid dehydrogenase subunit beta [Planctomycetota bacterium]
MPWSKFDSNYTAPSGGRDLTFCGAIREGIDQAMGHDPRVFAIGLDADDKFGVFGSMSDLRHPERVIGTPISENAMTGVAIGAALSGLRPIHVHLRVDFMLTAMDQLVNYAAKWHDMFGRQSKLPLVVRGIVGRGWGCGAQHSQTLHGWFAHIPGLVVVTPSTPYDAKGLLLASIAHDQPVIFLEHRWLYKNTGPVPEAIYTLPLGVANTLHRGDRLTVVASSLAAMHALAAIRERGLDVDLIDPRTIKPLDIDTITASVRRTGRLLVIDHDFPFGGFAAEVCTQVVERAFTSLRRPPQRLCFPDLGMPSSPVLERAYYPSIERLGLAMQRAVEDALEIDPAAVEVVRS